MKRIRIFSGIALMALFSLATQAQTNPAAQALPYSFTALSTTTLPNGMAAHRFGTSAGSIPTTRTTINGNGDLPLGPAANQGGWKNEGASGISMLSSGTNAAGAIVVAINTTGLSNITVSWKAATLFQQASRDNSLALQYRLGTTGNWTDVGTTTTYSTTGMADGHVSGTFTETLPAAANNQAVVQVRWMYWESAGSAGSRDRIGLDEISITGSSAACTAPTTQASAITFPTVNPTSLGVNWTNGNGAGRVVLINTTNSFTDPTNASNPTANTVYGGSGQQVVYNGTGSGPVTVTGLTPQTTYFFRVYEFCSPTRNYQTATATNNPNSTQTAAIPSTITTTGTYGPICNEVANSVNVTYTTTGTFTGTYTAQLSDAAGSFASPTAIGTGASPIVASIPAGLPAGTGYRIRVVNDAPAINGTANGSNIIISALPVVNLGNDTAYCAGTAFNRVLNAQNTGSTYDWNNGAASTQTFTATTAGTYTVKVTNVGGCIAYDTLTVTENALPTVNIGNDTAYCAGSTFNVTLDAQNTGATYDWNNGAAGTQTFAVNTAGTYAVAVTDTNGCVGHDTLTVTENTLPIVTIGNDTAYCAGSNFSLWLDAQNAGATYDWNNGAANTQAVWLDTAGTYSVIVTDLNGCVGYDTVTVSENALPVVNLGNDTAYCMGTTFNATLDAQNTGATYDWNNGAASTQTFAVDTAGTYSVTVTDINGCETTDTLHVTENTLPVVNLGNNTSYCAEATFNLVLDAQNAGASYDWNNGAANTQTFAVDTAGTYVVIVTDINGCENTDTLTVIENGLPVVELGNDTAYCAGTAFSVVLDAQPNGDTYDWNNGAANTQTFTADTAGTYSVTVTDDLGCENTDQVTVTENALPTVNIEDDTFFCTGTNFSLVLDAGNPGASYNWNNGTASTQTFTATAAGMYTVSVTDTNGCVNSDTSNISEKPLPIVSLGNDSAYCEGSTFSWVLDAQNPGASYSWNGGAATTQTFTATQAGTYTVNVTDVFGCTNSATVEVTENALPNVNLGADVSTPNASQTLNAGSGFATYLWAPGGQTTQQVTVNQTGNYSVTVTNAEGCEASDTVHVTLNNNASINEAALQAQISLYPNPAREKITVSLNYQGSLQVDIINLNGQLLKSQKTVYQNQQGLEIDVQNLPAGMYVVRFSGTDLTATRQLIIQQ